MEDNKTAHRAIEYDEKINITIPYYDKFHTETIDIIKTLNASAKTWLDTGCGTGNLVIKAVESFLTHNLHWQTRQKACLT